MPAGYEAIVLSALYQPFVEQRDGRFRQLSDCLREGLLGYIARKLRPVIQMGNKLIEFSLDALARAAHINATSEGRGCLR